MSVTLQNLRDFLETTNASGTTTVLEVLFDSLVILSIAMLVISGLMDRIDKVLGELVPQVRQCINPWLDVSELVLSTCVGPLHVVVIARMWYGP